MLPLGHTRCAHLPKLFRSPHQLEPYLEPYTVRALAPGSDFFSVGQHQAEGQSQTGGQAGEVHPFLPGVGQAAGHSAYGIGRDAQREGDIAVGGAGLHPGFLSGDGPDDIHRMGGKAVHGVLVQRAVAGADSQQLYFKAAALPFPVGQRGAERRLHPGQVFLCVGAELIEHGRLLRDGVDGGAPFDAADVVGDPGRRDDAVELVRQAAEQPDGAGFAKVLVGVAAGGPASDTVPPGAHRPCAAGRHIHIK